MKTVYRLHQARAAPGHHGEAEPCESGADLTPWRVAQRKEHWNAGMLARGRGDANGIPLLGERQGGRQDGARGVARGLQGAIVESREIPRVILFTSRPGAGLRQLP